MSASVRTEPFAQLPFEELPERPRRPHPFLDLPQRSLVMASRPFGEMRVSWREAGEGPPLLLVHGLMTSGYSWRYVIEPLAERYRVIVPDLPGAGLTDKPDVPYHPEALATWLAELMRELDVYGCRVVGNSLGGFLCMRLALDQPESMQALVDIHSPAFPDFRLRVLHAALALSPARRLLARLVARDPVRWAHRHVHYRDESLKSLEEAHVYGEPLSSDAGRTAFVRYMAETLAPAGFRRLLDDLRGSAFPVPLLLLYAKEDPMVDPSTGSRLAELVPDASLVWLDEASHFAQVDRPQALVRAVEAFFASA